MRVRAFPGRDTKVWGSSRAKVGEGAAVVVGYIALKARFKQSASFHSQGRERVVRLLLLLPFIGLMIVPFYNVREPHLFGFPFFYWYQLAWVPLTSLLTYIVYRSVRRAD